MSKRSQSTTNWVPAKKTKKAIRLTPMAFASHIESLQRTIDLIAAPIEDDSHYEDEDLYRDYEDHAPAQDHLLEFNCSICDAVNPNKLMVAMFIAKKYEEPETKRIMYSISHFNWPMYSFTAACNAAHYDTICKSCCEQGCSYFSNITKTKITSEHMAQVLRDMTIKNLADIVLGYLNYHVL
jgi:hypothetical protein